MTWTDLKRHHPQVLDQLCADFPYLKRNRLRRGGSDWVALVVSFAGAHDLTFREATERLQNWLIYNAAPLTLPEDMNENRLAA